MRKSFGLIVAATFVVAGQAHAVTIPFSGILSVSFLALSPITVSGSGTATISGLNLTSLQVPASTFVKPFFSAPTNTAAVPPLKGIQALNVKNSANITGFNFNGTHAVVPAGKMGIRGTANLCFFGVCNGHGTTLTSTNPAPTGNLAIPFTRNGTRGVGLGGAILLKGAITITVNGNPWLSGVAKVGTLSGAGFVHGPASGGASTAGQAGGVVQLVTPTLVSTNIGSLATIPSIDILNLTFVPEPSTLLLLGSGVVGLMVLGRRQMGK